ncbi:hypothetical protein BJ322DRAFT_1025533 [Thelephora terrestris]|uniref:Uncharacterized protein n=1 Tax=Thelephora terrestris TaxID=56493 RepID=A0A9P6H4F5_9AGAM|nr:hypothetical protein BJ322DRAFT_1025533 [Thelephora terrestris]
MGHGAHTPPYGPWVMGICTCRTATYGPWVMGFCHTVRSMGHEEKVAEWARHPTLRFLALSEPIGSSRQIVYFIGLFPNLQDLKLHYSDLKNCHENVADTTLIPLSSPPLRGRLTLIFFTREQIMKDMITLFGGLRFHRMDLFGVKCLPLLSEKCAGTLEMLRLYPTNPYGEAFSSGEEAVDSTEQSAAKSMCFNLSQKKLLRTLEITTESIVIAGDTELAEHSW